MLIDGLDPLGVLVVPRAEERRERLEAERGENRRDQLGYDGRGRVGKHALRIGEDDGGAGGGGREEER